MSGPIVPPLEVTEVDGSPDGRPITKLIVSNGDLTVSGRTATIDTSGTATTPGGADTQVQYNNAGAFGGAADFTLTGIGGTSPTMTVTNSASDAATLWPARLTLDGGTELSVLTTTNGDDGLLLATGADGVGGPFILLDVVSNPSNLSIKNAELNGTINIQTDSGAGDITLTTVGDLHLIAAQTLAFTAATTASVTSTTTNNDMNFNIIADGSGTPLINLKNDTKEVRLTCEDDDKLYVRGPTSGERFTLDASSSTGGITFPDTTTLVSAEGTAILATGVTDGYVLTADGANAAAWEAAGGGVSFPLEADAGSDVAPSYTFTGDTNTGMFQSAADKIGFTAGGTERLVVGYPLEVNAVLRVNTSFASGLTGPALSTSNHSGTGISFSVASDSNTVSIVNAQSESFRFGAAGEIGIGGATYGTSGQLLTSGGTGAAPTWADAAAVSFPLEAPNGGVGAPSYSFSNDTDTGMYFYTDFGNPVLSFTVAGSRRINVRHTGAIQFNDAYTFPTAVTGSNNYVLTAQTDGSTAWAAAAESLTLSTLQSEVAASSDFADFQSRIAAL